MLFDQLLTSIEQKFCRDDVKAYGSLGTWVGNTPLILHGRPFSFHKQSEQVRGPFYFVTAIAKCICFEAR
jgi:hypothetical protein